MVERRVGERQGPPVRDLEANVGREPPPGLDLGRELVDGHDLEARTSQGHGQQLRAREIQDALSRARRQHPASPGQLQVPARLERDRHPNHRLAQVAVPGEVSEAQANAQRVEPQPAPHRARL